MRKTTQALKILATWTPSAEAAADMTQAAFGDVGSASVMRITGGRISLKHAIKVDMTDPENAVRASKRIVAIKAGLAETGTIHSFNVVAGSAPIDEVEELPTEATEKDAA